MSIHSIREKINLHIYGSKSIVLTVLKFVSLSISVSALCVLIYYFGFEQTERSLSIIYAIIEGSLAFFVLNFLTRWFYDFEPLQFLKQNWFQALLVSILIVEGISFNLFDTLLLQKLFIELGLKSFSSFSVAFIQGYLLLIALTELFRSNTFMPNMKLNPAVAFALSFVILAGVGTVLLMLPEMTTAPGGMPFIDALFTSTSASCVTGLIVVDTATYFTFKGQFVIMMLMKLGGLNIVSFAVILALLSRLGVGLRQHSIIEDFVTTESLVSTKRLLGSIVIFSVVVEGLSTMVIYSLITPEINLETTGDKLFFSAFHAISSFNNAGFSTLSGGLYNAATQHSFLLHVVLGGLVFVGAIGFTTIFDLFSFKNLRERLKQPWKRPQLSSRIAINSYLILALIGAVGFFLLERNNATEDMSMVNAVITSFFHSVSARSAGLNTIDTGNLMAPTIVLTLFLMFVGGSTYSTAGGIKTSTFVLILNSTIATVRGKKQVELSKRTIPHDDLLKAFAVLLFNLGGVLTGIFLLSITEGNLLQEGHTFLDLTFEQVSAFSTCGLSTGITPYLSHSGKVIIVLSMFIGRIGTLTVAFALSGRTSTANYKYPEEHVMVG